MVVKSSSQLTLVQLAQLERHQSRTQEVWDSIPTGGNLFAEFIFLVCVLAFADNVASFV